MSSDSTERRHGPPALDEGGVRELAAGLRAVDGLRRVSRRAFVGGTLAAGLLAVDMFATRAIQEQRRQTVVLTANDDDTRRRFPGTSWILFPGYKTSWEEAQLIITLLRPSLGERGQLAAVGYSNNGLDVGEVMSAIRNHAARNRLTELHLYGHSFGGMLAVDVASRLLRESSGPSVGAIVLDSTPASKYDVKDLSWFEGVVELYELGFRVPSVLRGGYELGERIVNKHERTWTQVVDQTLEQLTPLAPSSVLIQTESEYIYNWDVTRFRGELGHTQLGFIGNPGDQTVDYLAARARWGENFPDNLVSSSLQTLGAFPAHASPEWSAFVYNSVLAKLLPQLLPLPRKLGGAGGGVG
ncbi:thioesterase domain-containing protein [Sinomonas sp. ASV322]|uniref:thioesterase domain-containing protein n=1 Tax=Sinomonas sp. ASV322 TaxID=3041920 RepID=UPI0027DAB706|nr:alpha/beta hydrolase [Sinomonas sp. ASV322]MDQ4502846.1 alpha/beta hydrolase [Sinomonas sp. ASV322]